ncbi:hypothetical protein QTG54_005490 [Skeletonema marinoi]|uniref:Uncharacterized protein n=1 Tax=Skeletonema marinoi TaxID=267567 RepID=A0AAD9DFP9_9STRA|nr:hypothetical protein QTG54_005490 [Skeletonema marinoi]
MKRKQSLVSLTLSALAISSTDAFSSSPNTSHHRIATSLSAVTNENNNNNNKLFQTLAATTAAMTILTSPLMSLPGGIANADEYGRETEAPTLFTGETTMICKKRGPLGACLETTIRTVDNDNDKASKYFVDPSEKMKARQAAALATQEEDNEGNALIQKLRKQSVDNKEKNDLIVRQKTLLNDQSASFGPFDRQVVILNTDGKTFTLLQNPQAMRLKKAGYIEDRKFIIQPTQQVIEDALEGKDENLGDAIKGFFGGGGDKSGEGDVVAAAVSESASSDSSPSSVVEEETTSSVEEVVSESQPESVDAAAVESS